MTYRLEFFPILLLITIKAVYFAYSRLTIHTDNSSIAAAINTQTSKKQESDATLKKICADALKK